MDLQLSRIENAPRSLPAWELILDDLGRPPAPAMAKALGVGKATVYRWNAAGKAPRMATLALFWLTTWGRSMVDAQATNDARQFAGLARSLADENKQLKAQIEALDYDLRAMAANRRLTLDQRSHDAGKEESVCQIEPNWKVLLEPSPPVGYRRALPDLSEAGPGRQVKTLAESIDTAPRARRRPAAARPASDTPTEP